LKTLLQKISIALVVLIILGFVIETGSAVPPENALVYVNPERTTYYPPTRTPSNQGYIATSYKSAKKMGAKPDKLTGFNVDGPSLTINMLVTNGVISSWPRYWSRTNVAIEYYE
jgi:hypothetical protein